MLINEVEDVNDVDSRKALGDNEVCVTPGNIIPGRVQSYNLKCSYNTMNGQKLAMLGECGSGAENLKNQKWARMWASLSIPGQKRLCA